MPAKHPYMEFYPGDWLKDTACLKGEHKGIWISLIVDLWQMDGEGQYTLPEIASISSVTIDAARAFLATAHRRGLATFSSKVDAAIDGDVDAVFTVICRRIKREKKALAMHVSRQMRYKSKAKGDAAIDGDVDATLTVQKSEVISQNTELTAKTTLSKSPPNNGGDCGRLPGLPSSIPEPSKKRKRKGNGHSEVALAIYEAYPKRVGRASALKAIDAAIARGADPEHLKRRTALYADCISRWPKDRRRFVPMPSTWFDGERYDDNEAEWEHVEERRGGPIGPCGKIGDFSEVEKKGWDA